MDLSIIILTRNRELLLANCIKSVIDSNIKVKYEIILIDNASTDGTSRFAEELCRKYKNIIYIRNRQNKGVGAGRNIGIKKSSGSFIMFLDDDACVKNKGAINKLLEFMKKNTDCWVAGPKTFLPNGNIEYSCRTFYNFPTILFRRTPLGKFFPNTETVRKHLMLDWDHNSARSVDWVAGAGFLVNRRAFEELGLFENTKFGFEDVDFCYRVNKTGKKVFYVPAAEIVHRVTGSSRSFNLNYVHHMYNALRFFSKHKKINLFLVLSTIFGILPINSTDPRFMGYPDRKRKIWQWDFLCHDKHGLEKCVSLFLRGKNLNVLDVGGGISKLRTFFTERGHNYTCLDIEDGADIKANAEEMPIESESIDFIICIQLLEHVRYPQRVVDEIYRVLKKGGRAVATAPGIWALHPCPEDNWRYLPGGLRVLFRRFKNVYIINSFGSTFCFVQNMNVYLSNKYNNTIFKLPILSLVVFNNIIGTFLKTVSRSDHYVTNYTVVADK